MASNDTTNVRLRDNSLDVLFGLKNRGESYSDVIDRLVEEAGYDFEKLLEEANRTE